jgi:hypothetical protein
MDNREISLDHSFSDCHLTIKQYLPDVKVQGNYTLKGRSHQFDFGYKWYRQIDKELLMYFKFFVSVSDF